MSGSHTHDGDFDEARAREVIGAHAGLEGATLPILHALQAEFGYVDRRCTALIAEALNVSKADVHGVVSFYHDFRHAPPGKHVLKLCRAEACQANGADALVDRLAFAHGRKCGATDGPLTIDNVYCLGNCALGPAALLDGEPVGRLDAGKIDAIVRRCTGGAP